MNENGLSIRCCGLQATPYKLKLPDYISEVRLIIFCLLTKLTEKFSHIYQGNEEYNINHRYLAGEWKHPRISVNKYKSDVSYY